MSATNPENVDDAIEYFLEDKKYLGSDDETIANYRMVLSDFEEFIHDPERNPKGERLDPGEADRRVCMAWVSELREDEERNLADSTIASYAASLHGFYNYMSNEGIFEANPMSGVLEAMPEEVEKNPTRRELSVEQVSEFIQQVRSPLAKALIMLWAKTGMRHGETINLDIRDVHIDDPAIKDEYPAVRSEIEDQPDAIFVQSNISSGDVVNGEKRRHANKRKRDTVVPIDDEMKLVLARWLAVRPDSAVCSDGNPLFTATFHKWGHRLSESTVREVIRAETEPYGWWDGSEDYSTNVTPHYFRHFFTTHMRDSGDDDYLVKFIRGDVGDDIMDTYTHDWGNRVRDAYLDSIYKLL